MNRRLRGLYGKPPRSSPNPRPLCNWDTFRQVLNLTVLSQSRLILTDISVHYRPLTRSRPRRTPPSSSPSPWTSSGCQSHNHHLLLCGRSLVNVAISSSTQIHQVFMNQDSIQCGGNAVYHQLMFAAAQRLFLYSYSLFMLIFIFYILYSFINWCLPLPRGLSETDPQCGQRPKVDFS